MIDKITWGKTLERLDNLPPIENLSGKDRKFYSEIGHACILVNLFLSL